MSEGQRTGEQAGEGEATGHRAGKTARGLSASGTGLSTPQLWPAAAAWPCRRSHSSSTLALSTDIGPALPCSPRAGHSGWLRLALSTLGFSPREPLIYMRFYCTGMYVRMSMAMSE